EVALVAGTTALATPQAKGIEGETVAGAPARPAGSAGAADADRGADAHADRAAAPPAEPAVIAEDDSAPPLAAAPRAMTGPARSSAGPEPVRPERHEPATPAVHDLRSGTSGSVTALPQRPPVPAELASAMDDGDLWIATLERHVDRAQREGGGLALLRVELVDGERLASAAADESQSEADERGVPYGRLAQAIRRAIRRQDLVASDRQGRAWVIAPAVGRAGAIALAERIGAGVEHGEHWRGAPLAATIGFAVYGEDGRDAVTLIDRAEEAMLAASAAGVRIGEAVPAPDGGEGGTPGPRLVR
ncbi:MAG TPA: diguanylate cyclase, partial [Conexibacter sp.]|nr:diguanylate cyclase [Conexibacter sp.]